MPASRTPVPHSAFRCFLCATPELEPWLIAGDRNQRVDEQLFEIMRCPKCRLASTIHSLSVAQLGRYYPRIYYSLDDNRQMESSRTSRRYRQYRLDRIQRYVPHGMLLDVGSGTGMFMKSAREAGFGVEGLELSNDAAEFGVREWGLSITHGDLHEAAIPPDRYDVVTLSHVFEHLYDPLRAARKLHSILKTGGLLVVAVPNAESFQARLFGRNWYHLDVPRHLYHYAPASLTALLKRVGFTVLEINFFSPEHNWGGILGSVMTLNPPGESFIHKATRKIVGAPLAKAAAYVEAVLGRGGTFEVYARK